MKQLSLFIKVLIILSSIVLLITTTILIYSVLSSYKIEIVNFDLEISEKLASFSSNTIGINLTFLSILLVLKTIIDQNNQYSNNNITNIIYKQIEFSREDLKQISESTKLKQEFFNDIQNHLYSDEKEKIFAIIEAHLFELTSYGLQMIKYLRNFREILIYEDYSIKEKNFFIGIIQTNLDYQLINLYKKTIKDYIMENYKDNFSKKHVILLFPCVIIDDFFTEITNTNAKIKSTKIENFEEAIYIQKLTEMMPKLKDIKIKDLLNDDK